MQKKSLLIILTQGPNASSNNQEALDIALAAASFDQPVSLLFEGDGIYQLLTEQDPNIAGRKNLSKAMKAFPIYGIDKLYAFAGNTTLLDNKSIEAIAKSVGEAEYAGLIRSHATVLRF